jgi:selenocysteine lyase/cysteine desulfurase
MARSCESTGLSRKDFFFPIRVFPVLSLFYLKIVIIDDTPDGLINLNDLALKLEYYNVGKFKHFLKIGSFSAASNITGILTDVKRVSSLLHKYNFLAFFDFATAASHVDIDMNPNNDKQAYIDAIFVSTHKLIGGPQTPGELQVLNSLKKRRKCNASFL